MILRIFHRVNTAKFENKGILVLLLSVLLFSGDLRDSVEATELPAYLKKVEALVVSNKYDEAIKTARGLEKSHPKSAVLKGLIASAYMYKGDNEAARKAAEEALKIDGRNYEGHWVLSNVYMALGKPELGAKESQLAMKYQSKKFCKPCAKKKLLPAKPD